MESMSQRDILLLVKHLIKNNNVHLIKTFPGISKVIYKIRI